MLCQNYCTADMILVGVKSFQHPPLRYMHNVAVAVWSTMSYTKGNAANFVWHISGMLFMITDHDHDCAREIQARGCL